MNGERSGRARTTRRLRTALLASSALALAWALPAAPAQAQDATWLASPGSNDYGTGSSWSTGGVPGGTAFFDTSNTTSLSISSASVSAWTFNVGASNYSFDVNSQFSFTGPGITVNGGSVTVTNKGILNFYNTSSAGSAVINNVYNPSNFSTTALNFYGTSSAGTSVINNTGLSYLTFNDSSTAGHATITNNGGIVYFQDGSSAGSANITNNGMLVIFQGHSSAGSATITNSYGGFSFLDGSSAGSAAITNNGTGAFSNSSTAGNATIANNSELYFFDGSTAGSAVINNITNYATTDPVDIRFSGTSSAGTSVITNGSTTGLGFSDTSTAGSASITNNGLAGFGDSSTAGNATIHNNSILIFGGNSTAGSATITNNANGGLSWMEFDQHSTAGNATIVNNDQLYFQNSSTAGSATITNNNNMFFNNFSTAGSAILINNGSIDFSGTSGPNGDNKISAGSIAGTGSYMLGANELTVGSNNLSTEASGAITGTGASLVKIGTGTLTLSGANTYSGGTTINAGTLQLGSAGGVGSIVGTVTVGASGTLEIVNADTSGITGISNSGTTNFRSNTSAGSAQLVNSTSNAVFDLSMTSGPNGDNKLSAGSLAGMGTFELGGKELTVGSNNLSTNVTGVLADGGSGGGTGASLVKVGTGRLTLSNINTYTGATTIDGGTLAVNGDITASSGVTVNAGGALGGTGIVGSTTIASGGALAPGNSIGTLTVSGNLTFAAGSFYAVEVSTTTADRTNVSGTATLTGATVQAVALPGSFRSQTYTILNATGGFGGTQFAGLSVTGSFSPARNPHLTYDLNNVYLVLDAGTIVLPPGTGGNLSNVAGAINKAVEGGATPPAGFDALLNMGNPQLGHALNQVSGQPGAAGTQASFGATQQFVGMLDPGGGMDAGRGAGGSAPGGGALGYASTGAGDARVREAYAAVTPRDASGDVIDRRWGVWASAYGGASTLNGSTAAGSSTTTSRIYGIVVGADYRVSPDTVIGFALGGAGFNFALADSLGGGRADLFQAGLYGRHTFGAAYISASIAYGWQDVTTDRTVTVSGIDRLTANYKASTFSGRLEAGWRFAPIPASSFGVTPYAAAQVTTFHLPGYGETALVGSNQFALSYNSQDTTNVRTELGARTDQSFLVNDGVLTLRGRLAWAHDSNTNRLVSAAFQTLPGAAFTVSGAQPAADSALLGGRAEMKWRNGLSLAGTVEGEFSQSTQTYTGKGTVRYEW